MKTAALIVIGDEILTGKVRDENSFIFANTMFNRGVRVPRIITIPDDVDIIADSVRSFSLNYSYVCTSGGVGPTHDDRTHEAIAKAFNRPLVRNEATAKHFLQSSTDPNKEKLLLEAQEKMLMLPRLSEVYFLPPMWMPLTRVENVFIFPGVPVLFERYMLGFAHLFSGMKFFRKTLYTDKTEIAIAKVLSIVQEKYKTLSIGSYPQIPRKDYGVMVTIEGSDEKLVDEACTEVFSLISGRFNK